MKKQPRWLSVLLLLVLTGCSGRQVQESPAGLPEFEYQQRSSMLQALDDWEFTGRLAIDDGRDGGSGRLNWRTRDTSSQLDFRGALGRGAWRLLIGPNGARLERGDGSAASAATAHELVRQEIGWQVPVRSLQWWVLGLRAPGPFSAMDLDEEGLIRSFEQGGWTIEFKRYLDVSGIGMPRRMEAVSGPYRVKLAVSRWDLGTGEPGDG